MKNIHLWVVTTLYALVLYALVVFSVQADEFKIVEKHWNENSPEAQYRFSRDVVAVHAQAHFGIEAENGRKLTVLKTTQLNQNLVGAQVAYDNVPMLWVIRTDTQGKWIGWWQRQYQPTVIGGMERGALLDAGSTALAIGQGFAEGNPLGLGGAGLIKAGLLYASRTATFDDCLQIRAASDTVWTGAAVANVLTMLGAPMGVSLIGLVATAYARQDQAVQNAMWECTGFALN